MKYFVCYSKTVNEVISIDVNVNVGLELSFIHTNSCTFSYNYVSVF